VKYSGLGFWSKVVPTTSAAHFSSFRYNLMLTNIHAVFQFWHLTNIHAVFQFWSKVVPKLKGAKITKNGSHARWKIRTRSKRMIFGPKMAKNAKTRNCSIHTDF
jgi:hypothetical protein